MIRNLVLFTLFLCFLGLPGSVRAQGGAASEPEAWGETAPSGSPAQESSTDAQGTGYVHVGLGLPEVIHLTAGFFVSPRVSVDARVGGVVYSPYVGIGATRYLTPLNELDGGGTFYLSGGGRFNPGTTSTAGQEQVLWAATASVGRRSGTRGFFLDARLTAWVGMTNRELIAFPSLAASVGFAY